MPKMAKKEPYNLYGWAFYKSAKVALTKKIYINLPQIPSQNSGQTQK